jgi:UDP-glucose 4-epimerase
MKKILVTGGAGYIGSQIVFDLVDLGYKVVIADNLSTGHKKLINKKAIFYKVDVGNKVEMEKIFLKHPIDQVIHLAASLSVEESMKNPSKYYLNNVVNTKNLLEICGKYKIKKFIFSSTCAIFGEGIKKVQESEIPNPTSHYGLTKFLCENLIENLSKKFKFYYYILRYFNVVGADVQHRVGPINLSGQLFKNLSNCIENKKYQINIYGKNYQTRDGTCIRDYIDVNDLSRIHINCLTDKFKKKSRIINCGYGYGFSVLEIVKKFEKISGKILKKKYLPPRKGDVSEVISVLAKKKEIQKILSNNFDINESVKNALFWEKKIIKNNK